MTCSDSFAMPRLRRGFARDFGEDFPWLCSNADEGPPVQDCLSEHAYLELKNPDQSETVSLSVESLPLSLLFSNGSMDPLDASDGGVRGTKRSSNDLMALETHPPGAGKVAGNVESPTSSAEDVYASCGNSQGRHAKIAEFLVELVNAGEVDVVNSGDSGDAGDTGGACSHASSSDSGDTTVDYSEVIEREMAATQSLSNTYIWDLQKNTADVVSTAKRLADGFVAVKFGITQSPFWRMHGCMAHRDMIPHHKEWERMFILFVGTGAVCGALEFHLINDHNWGCMKCQNEQAGGEQSHYDVMFVYMLAETVDEVNRRALLRARKRRAGCRR